MIARAARCAHRDVLGNQPVDGCEIVDAALAKPPEDTVSLPPLLIVVNVALTPADTISDPPLRIAVLIASMSDFVYRW